MRQAWVPRVLFAFLGVFLLCCLSPLATNLGGHATWVTALLVAFSFPVLLLAVVCLVAAARPGALGRAARRARGRRTR